MQTILKTYSYEDIPIAGFVDIILDGGEQADEAMYYLLHQRLSAQLSTRFEPFRHQLMDDFDDIVEDFFLYLREGKDEANAGCYPSLRRIQKREAFESWIFSTFHNYLSVRAAKEVQITYVDLSAQSVPDDNVSSSVLTDERRLTIVAQLIAYAHQELSPRDCFIFLRSLLTMLNKQQALPNVEMAKALGMTDLAYRVSVHRMKCRLMQYRTLLMRGKGLLLDEPHRQMAQRINDDFNHLYPTLMHYYGQTLDTLNHADAVKQLRQEFLTVTGNMLHEAETPYAIAPSIASFWTRLSRFLVV